MTVLLLAGTGEGREIATALAQGSIPAIASLAGATRSGRALAIPTRVGGFGGDGGFRDYLSGAGISAIVDATHPFAHRISARTARIAQEFGLPYLQLLRPEWQPEEGDQWYFTDNEAQVSGLINAQDVVFLATGRQTLGRFANMTAQRIICRQIDPPEAPFPFVGGEYLVGRPPFSVMDEERLFAALGVTWLVVKNAGGAASETKLIAARRLGIRVAMINRPPQPDGDKAASVDAALDWVRTL